MTQNEKLIKNLENMTIDLDYKATPEPSYYSGKKYGYSARKVVEDFNLIAIT